MTKTKKFRLACDALWLADEKHFAARYAVDHPAVVSAAACRIHHAERAVFNSRQDLQRRYAL
jgi:4-hydroxyphenylpyruvate dioxygenase-like putative hemolysin